MRGAVLVAIAATIGNFLQGWDNATIAGAVVYIKKDFQLKTSAEGLVVAMSLIGAVAITTFSGALADWIGRRPLLIISSVLYFISGIVMTWSPDVYVLLLARLLDGFGIGLAVTLVPLYISETAPSEIRGLLNTVPQFAGSVGMFLSYCMIFGMSLRVSPSWRLMLGVLSIPSLIYFALTVFYLPESPRWLVSKGRMLEAKQVLQRLRGVDDVAGEMALLVEGLGVGGETTLEEYIIGPDDEHIDDLGPNFDKDRTKLYGVEEGLSWVAKPVTGQSTLGLASHHGSLTSPKSIPFMDPLVTLFGSMHEKLSETGSMRSMLVPNFGSMFSTAEPHAKNEHWDEENLHEVDDYASETGGGDSDGNLTSPLISRQTTSMEKGVVPPPHGSILSSTRHGSSLVQGHGGEPASSQGIGGGWQLAWKWSEREGEDGKEQGGFKKVYLHEGALAPRQGSVVSISGSHGERESVPVTALVSQAAFCSKELLDLHPVGPAMVHPAKTASKAPTWSMLLEPGVKHALIVGMGIQMLQQLSGINGVMYYTPQILEQAGVSILLSNLGLSSTSASFLISALTTLLMLPSIGVAMKLMDIAGRRWLLLTTLPVLVLALVILVLGNIVNLGSVVHATFSTVCVIIYFCVFVMGYGPVPNILCSEIFPTQVRGLCIAICALVYWAGDILVTYTLPVMMSLFGLTGIFGFYAIMCAISLAFVFFKVPETKGMPLEVITEFFAVGARQAAAAKSE